MKLLLKIINWIANFIRSKLKRRLVKLRSKLRMDSLRTAIGKADENKKKTGRKNIVVFNNHSGTYEPLQKRLLKFAQKKGKIKGQPAQTEYRKKRPVKKKSSRFTKPLIDKLERDSAYVTK